MPPRILGHKHALETILLSVELPAQLALAAGLINPIVPAAGVEAETLRLARDLVTNSATSNAATRFLLRASDDLSLDWQLDQERTNLLKFTRKCRILSRGTPPFSKNAPQRPGGWC